jgi:chromosome partitioning protein
VRRLAILNHKGGVGKTTTCFNLASAYADQGLKVLCIDLDPQGHLAVSLGVTEPGLEGVDSLFFDDAELPALLVEAREGIDLLPAGYRLGEIERLAAEGRQRAQVLNRKLSAVEEDYDLLLIDCPPNSGLLNFNALFAADEVLIPVSGDYLALHGLSQLLRTLNSAERFMKKPIRMWIALTRFAVRRRLANQVREKLIKYFPDKLLATPVRENAPLAESPSFGKSIFDYSRRSNGAQDYRSLADDLLYGRVVSTS